MNQGRGRVMHTVSLLLALMMVVVVMAGCSAPLQAVGNFAGRVADVQLTSVPVKMLLAASNSAIEVASEEYFGTRVDLSSMIERSTGIDIGPNATPAEVASLMVINKLTNETQAWTLSDDVKSIRLDPKAAESIELRIVNESPLRIEVWVDGTEQQVDAIVDFAK
jgi:hypothetical protein